MDAIVMRLDWGREARLVCGVGGGGGDWYGKIVRHIV